MSSADSLPTPSIQSDEYEAIALSASDKSTRAEASLLELTSVELPASKADRVLDEAVNQAIDHLITDDFQSQWDQAKQFSKQFAEWGDRVVPALIQRLEQTEDPDSQWILVRILSQFRQPAVVETLSRLLVTTPDATLQTEVIKALTNQGTQAIATLSNLLQQQTLSNKRLAVRTLARIRRSGTIEPLLSVAADTDMETRAIALEALGSFHDPRVTPVLIAALEDKPIIAIEAIRTLGRRRDLIETVDLVASLQPHLHSRDRRVATESAIALGRLGTESAAIALSQSLQAPLPTSVKAAAARALGWLDIPSATTGLAAAFALEAPIVTTEVRQAIAQALSQTQQEALKLTAAEPLLDWLGNVPTLNVDAETVRLKQTVITALAQIGNCDAIDNLLPLLADSDRRIPMHVLNALKQIDPQSAKYKVNTYLQSTPLSEPQKAELMSQMSDW